MPFRCEGSCGCPECVGGLLGPPDDAVGALGGAKLARNRQNASISLVEIPGQKIPPKSRLGPSHGVHLREAALRSHGRVSVFSYQASFLGAYVAVFLIYYPILVLCPG